MPDLFGYVAYAFVLLSTSTNDARWFRTVMVGSNICFIIYGLALQLMPVLVFNMLLFTMNVLQAARAWRKHHAEAAAEAAASLG